MTSFPATTPTEGLYRSVIAAMAEGVVVQNATGAIIENNASAEKILGLTADQMRGRTSIDSRWRAIREDGMPFPGDDHPAMVTLRTGVAQNNVVMGIHKPDDSLTWISINTQPMYIAGSTAPHAVVASFLDISTSRRAEQRLRESEERWLFALESAGDGVWDWDVKTGQVYFSRRWKEMLGYAETELANDFTTFEQLLHPDDANCVHGCLQHYLSGKTSEYRVEFRMRCRDGGYKWILTRGKVISHDNTGAPERFVGTHSDITERKKLEQMKDEFVSTVSHELRTPLTSIQGGIALALSGVLGDIPAKAAEVLVVSQRNAKRLSQLVNDILDCQRLESGRIQFKFETACMRELLTMAIEADEAFAAQKHIALTVLNCDDVAILVDRIRFSQVMSNLLSNAIKFSPDGARVEIAALATPQSVVITVRDYGAGIPDDFKPKLFERFSQAEQADNRAIQHGTGLGLAISKKLVEGMNGRLWCVSQIGKGSMFSVELPRPPTQA